MLCPSTGPRSLLVVAAVASVLLSSQQQVNSLENGLARTPPMGWLAWERFLCNTDCETYPNECISGQLFREMADKLVSGGFKESGYEYVNIDDCWSEKLRDAENGQLVGDRQRFPEGISKLSEYIHAKGLKIGIYGDCGTSTCAGYPAQLKSSENLEDNYFKDDASLFAEWQIDSFKFDGCNLDPLTSAEKICPKMIKALNETNRPMLVTCEWPFYMLREKMDVNYQIAADSCNTMRYYEDVVDSWQSILNIIDFSVEMQLQIARFHGPGHWFDPDQLVIGNFALSEDEAKAQMAIWSIWSAPLYMSNDLRELDPKMAAILRNKNLISVDQDQLGVFGLMVAQVGELQVFAKPVEPIRNKCPSFVVAYLNRATLGNTKSFSFKLRDLLGRVPVALAAQRYERLYATSEQKPGGGLVAQDCRARLQSAMTKNPANLEGPTKPAGANEKPVLETEQVYYAATDLFEPEKRWTVGLSGDLKLDVNPSGVTIVKLVETALA